MVQLSKRKSIITFFQYHPSLSIWLRKRKICRKTFLIYFIIKTIEQSILALSTACLGIVFVLLKNKSRYFHLQIRAFLNIVTSEANALPGPSSCPTTEGKDVKFLPDIGPFSRAEMKDKTEKNRQQTKESRKFGIYSRTKEKFRKL